MFGECRKLSSHNSIKVFNIYISKMYKSMFIGFYREYENDPELREKYENSLYILGTLQYPTFKDLAIFSNYNPVINVPTDSIKDLMLKVTLQNVISILVDFIKLLSITTIRFS